MAPGHITLALNTQTATHTHTHSDNCVIFAATTLEQTPTHHLDSICWIRLFFHSVTPPPSNPHPPLPTTSPPLPDPNYLLTSVNPCIPNTLPDPSTSHLLLPCPLLYYPAGIALGTLQSFRPDPRDPPADGGPETMTFCWGRRLVFRGRGRVAGSVSSEFLHFAQVSGGWEKKVGGFKKKLLTKEFLLLRWEGEFQD